MKGNLCVELTASEARNDIHSMYGTIIPNPLWNLTWTLASIKGPNHIINVPGWYDSVKQPTKADLEVLQAEPIDVEYLKNFFNIKHSIT